MYLPQFEINPKSCITACILCSQFASVAAQAQQQVEGSDDLLETIIVTAQRREQATKDVPIALTAFSAGKLEDYQIRGLEDYTALSPNIGFASQGTPLAQAVSIRGISDLGGTVAPISVFVDDFNTTASGFFSALDANLFDVERIEVLRGPQGTLFGRNVSGGAISIVTEKPGDQFEGSVFAEYGRYDHYLLRGSVNLPVSDGVAVRLSAFTDSNDGFIDNIGPSGETNDYEASGGRIAMRLTPSESLTADFAVSYTDTEQGLSDRVPTGLLSAFLSANGFPVDPGGSYSEIGFYPDNEDTVATDSPTSSTREITLFTGNVEKEFDGTTAVVTFGYMDLDTFFEGDLDYTGQPFNLFEPDTASGRTWSVEGRLQSNDSSKPLSWIVGVVYAEDVVNGSSNNNLLDGFVTGVFGFPPGTAPLTVEDIDFRTEVESIAVFGDVSWDLSDRLSLGFGLRYAHDDVFESFTENETQSPFGGPPDPIVIPAQPAVTGDSSSDTITPRFSMTYAVTDDVNLYSSISRGARPGGSNLEAVSNPDLPDTYDEEIVWNYELGFKGNAFETSDFSFAVFYLDWSDLQAESRVFAPGDITGTNLTVSAGSARSYGLELELSTKLTSNFSVDGSLGYQDTEFEEFDTVDELGQPFDAEGNSLPLASDFMASLATQYTQQTFAGVEAFVRAEYSYRSEFYMNELNEAGAAPEVDGYETVNFRAGVDWGNLRVTVFGENLTNDGVNLGYQGGVGGIAGLLATVRPTRWGLNASYAFD